MDLAKRLGNVGVTRLVLNEIRGAIFVAVLLSSGTHLFGAGWNPRGRPPDALESLIPPIAAG